MTNHLSELEREGFVQVDAASMVLSDQAARVVFGPAIRGRDPRHPSVYAWVRCGADDSEVIYVGMASRGWRVRRGQHAGGMKVGKGAGAKNREGLLAALGRGGAVKILERRTSATIIFGMRAPLHGAEEWALIARFRPMLNKQTDIDRAVRFAEGTEG